MTLFTKNDNLSFGGQMSQKLDGSGLVVRKGRLIVVIKHNYGNPEHRLALPSGSVEPGENAEQAVIREAQEETGLVIRMPRHIGQFVQRYRIANGGGEGLFHLYDANGYYCGEPHIEPNEEIEWARYMSFEEIVERREEFGLGYLHLILQYMRCMDGLDPIPFYGRLSTPVKYEPWGLESKNLVLKI